MDSNERNYGATTLAGRGLRWSVCFFAELGKLPSVTFYHGSRFNAAGVAVCKNGFRLFAAGPVSGHTLYCDVYRITFFRGDCDVAYTVPQRDIQHPITSGGK